jgi:hypothetical protein
MTPWSPKMMFGWSGSPLPLPSSRSRPALRSSRTGDGDRLEGAVAFALVLSMVGSGLLSAVAMSAPA